MTKLVAVIMAALIAFTLSAFAGPNYKAYRQCREKSFTETPYGKMAPKARNAEIASCEERKSRMSPQLLAITRACRDESAAKVPWGQMDPAARVRDLRACRKSHANARAR